MSLSEQAARLVFPGYKFGVDDPAEAELLVDLGVGGFCLYGGLVREVADFTAKLQTKAARPLLFCADYEDGVASQSPGATWLPTNMGLGASGSEALAYRKGAITAAEARALGVRWVLAPVCDLATSPANPIVNVRAFSDEPQLVTRLARAYLNGLRSEGTLGCLKHFPGHGETSKDSHLELPTVEVERALLLRRELSPFAALAPEADAVMTGHLAVPALEKDRKIPYSLSADVAQTLRGRLGFRGLISTDALFMQAVADNFDELDAAERALRGGSDILLAPKSPRELVRLLPRLVEEKADLRPLAEAALGRLDAALSGFAVGRGDSELERVGCEEHRAEAAAMAEACLAWAGGSRRAPARVAYLEPEAGPDEWLGEAFVSELRAAGVAVRPADGGPLADDETLLAGVFLSPRAFAGRIRYDEEESGAARERLRSAGASAAIVSFGSPFVFDDLECGGLCAFSRADASQRAAARALAGRLEVKGRMPVPLKMDRA